jgi:predicted nucleotidyltransferase
VPPEADEPDFETIAQAAKKAATVLMRAEVPFALGGGLACWARGGPKTEHDVDFFVTPEHADRALEALEREGCRTERPPEQWLLKAWVDDVLVDLIFDPSGGPVTDEWIERAEMAEFLALRLPLARLEDVLVTKALAISEQDPDFSSVLEIARALREQIDWDEVRARTNGQPFAKAFLTLVEELDIA